jgi:hypothetical protein
VYSALFEKTQDVGQQNPTRIPFPRPELLRTTASDTVDFSGNDTHKGSESTEAISAVFSGPWNRKRFRFLPKNISTNN